MSSFVSSDPVEHQSVRLMAKVNIVHVPYKGGSAESAIAVAVGQIDVSFPNIPAALPLLEARKIRSLR